MKHIIRIAAMTGAVWLTFALLDGLHWNNDWFWLFVIAVVIAGVNTLIKPVAKLLSLPIRIATLGLFTLVLNVALMSAVIWFADSLDWGVASDGWNWTALGGVLLAIASSVVNAVAD